VLRDAPVTLLISEGPKPVTIPALAGMSLDEAQATLGELGVEVAEPVDRQFHAEVAADHVISAAGPEGVDLSAGAEGFEGWTVSLVVSTGPLPDIAGLSPEDAAAKLGGVELTVDEGRRLDSFSADIPAGQVIGLAPVDGPIRPGDTVGLNVSKGPEQVAVPQVVGKLWRDAKALLEAAGFQIAYKNGISEFLAGVPDSARVKSITPGEGELADKGSTVTVALEAG